MPLRPFLVALMVGEPDVSLLIHKYPVNTHEDSRAKVLDKSAGHIELCDRRQVRAGAGVCATSLGDPDGFAVAIDLYRGGRSKRSPRRQLLPVVDQSIRIGEVIDGRDVALGIGLFSNQADPHENGYDE